MAAPRVWLFLAASAFALTAVAGALLLYLEPTYASAGYIALALVFSLLCLHLGTRTATSATAPRAGCPHCGALLDGALTFCARCGA